MECRWTVCWVLRAAHNITSDQTQFKSNQKPFSTHTKSGNTVITLQHKTPTLTGSWENEAGLGQSHINMESCERICRGVWYFRTGDCCTLCSGALPTWRGSGAFGRAVGVWLLQEVTVEAALTWSTQSAHTDDAGWREGWRAGGRWGWVQQQTLEQSQGSNYRNTTCHKIQCVDIAKLCFESIFGILCGI